MAALVRSKANNDEIGIIIQSIEEQAKASATIDPFEASTDAFVTAICYIGSKSLSHLLSCIERNKERLLSIGHTSPEARHQILSSVLGYWQEQPGVGVAIVDKLLNYTILTPSSVVQWSLQPSPTANTSTPTSNAKNLSVAYIYEMLSSTVRKVTNRLRQIVLAYRQPGLPTDQVILLKETLERERADMKQLFAIIDESLLSIATGSQDQSLPAVPQDGEATAQESEEVILTRWAQRWRRTFRRKGIVEEAWLDEELAKPMPPPPAPPVETGVDGADSKMDIDGAQQANGSGGASVVHAAKASVKEDIIE